MQFLDTSNVEGLRSYQISDIDYSLQCNLIRTGLVSSSGKDIKVLEFSDVFSCLANFGMNSEIDLE